MFDLKLREHQPREHCRPHVCGDQSPCRRRIIHFLKLEKIAIELLELRDERGKFFVERFCRERQSR